MKKIILTVAVAGLALSCQKVTKGGNHGVLKLEDGVERYDTHERRHEGDHKMAHGHGAAHATENHGEHGAKEEHHTASASELNLDLNGEKLHAYKGGLEETIIGFLKADGYNKAADDDALKGTWYSFDHVNFKMGSSNQLEEGSQEQIDNLAKILKVFPDAKIKIGGYTDKTGDEAINKKISTARANFIKAELSKAGVGGQVVSAEGYGSEHATVPVEASDEERAKDRKMAVRFTK